MGDRWDVTACINLRVETSTGWSVLCFIKKKKKKAMLGEICVAQSLYWDSKQCAHGVWFQRMIWNYWEGLGEVTVWMTKRRCARVVSWLAFRVTPEGIFLFNIHLPSKLFRLLHSYFGACAWFAADFLWRGTSHNSTWEVCDLCRHINVTESGDEIDTLCH